MRFTPENIVDLREVAAVAQTALTAAEILLNGNDSPGPFSSSVIYFDAPSATIFRQTVMQKTESDTRMYLPFPLAQRLALGGLEALWTYPNRAEVVLQNNGEKGSVFFKYPGELRGKVIPVSALPPQLTYLEQFILDLNPANISWVGASRGELNPLLKQYVSAWDLNQLPTDLETRRFFLPSQLKSPIR